MRRVCSRFTNRFGLCREDAAGRRSGFRHRLPGGLRFAIRALPSGGARTAAQFRDGQIRVPLAFSGNYAPPFVGCIEFSGWADSVLDLEFDQSSQKLIGRSRVTGVHLDGTGGMGSTAIAKLLQSSIDKRLNPIEIFPLDKLSFGIPIPSTGTLRMRAVGIRHEVSNGVLNLRITYEFTKG